MLSEDSICHLSTGILIYAGDSRESIPKSDLTLDILTNHILRSMGEETINMCYYEHIFRHPPRVES